MFTCRSVIGLLLLLLLLWQISVLTPAQCSVWQLLPETFMWKERRQATENLPGLDCHLTSTVTVSWMKTSSQWMWCQWVLPA